MNRSALIDMSTPPDRPPQEEDILYEVLDLALAELEEGRSPHIDLILAGREYLRDRALEMIRLATRVSVCAARALPRVPGYTLIDELGRGGMGTVYLARQERVGGRAVALKVLPHASGLSQRARRRFSGEALAIGKLRHPNIVAIYDVIEDGDSLAYAMEWVDGQSLADAIRRVRCADQFVAPVSNRCSGPRPRRPESSGTIRTADPTTNIAQTCRLGIAIARALAAVHRAGLVHRDVKPSNILIRNDGAPLLSDFGLVRETDSTITTHADQFAGTVAYAAPEQLRGEQDFVDARSDVYSLGVTLFHALTRRLPYRAGDPGSMLREINDGPKVFLRRANPAVPRDLETIIAKAIDPAPIARYQTADEFADDLERFLSFQPIRARRVSTLVRGKRWVQRHHALALGTLCGVLLSTAVVGGIFGWARWKSNRGAELVRQARLALLTPMYGEMAFISEYCIYPLDQTETARSWRAQVPSRCATALARYDQALQYVKEAQELETIKRERETVYLARQVVLAWTDRSTSRQTAVASVTLKTEIPKVSAIATTWKNASGPQPVPDAELTNMSREELCSLTLFAYLAGDPILALKAFKRGGYHESTNAGPLLNAVMGEHMLIIGWTLHAQSMLAPVVEVFPDAGFLAVACADAAIRRGDTQTGQYMLRRGQNAGMLDSFSTAIRVDADLEAELGRIAVKAADRSTADQHFRRARRLYEHMLRNHTAPTAHYHAAEFFFSQGELPRTIFIFYHLVRRPYRCPEYHYRFVAFVDHWWQALAEQDRSAIRQGRFEQTIGGITVDDLRPAYQKSLDFVNQNPFKNYNPPTGNAFK